MRRRLLLSMSLLGLLALAPAADKEPEPQWIWYPDGDPLASAPAETRYFRRTFDVEKVPASATLEITADNGFVVSLNGKRIGDGDRWEQLYQFDVVKHLKAGRNVLAVEGRNDGGPAALVVRIKGIVVSDGTWKASKTAPKGWLDADFDDRTWKKPAVIGAYGKVGPWTAGGVAQPDRPRTFKVPDEFTVAPAVKKPSDRGPFSIVNMTFDAKGRLLLSQEGGPTLLCKNLKDGQYQDVAVYCSQVKGSHGMCWVGDSLLLVGDGPKGTGLYRCRDTKGKDEIDEVKLLLAFKGGMGEHGPHGVLHGPDGWLYVVVGNHAFAQPDKLADNSPLTRWPRGEQGPDQGKPGTTEDVLLPRLDDANGHAAGLRAPGGTIWRVDLEGKNASLFSAGYRNHFDAAFSPSGELFTFDSDMEWDEGLPWYRAVRVCHSTPGSDFMWRTGAANTPNYYLDSLPPLLETGRGSPTGVDFCDNLTFPKKYRGAFFMSDWSLGIIYAVHLKRSGATYKAEAEKFCTGSPLNVTDCVFGPDGNLYFSTGGRGTQGGVHVIQPKTKREDRMTYADQPLSASTRAFWKIAGERYLKALKNGSAGLDLIDSTLHGLESLSDKDPVQMVLPSLTQYQHMSMWDHKTLTRLYDCKNAEIRAHAVWLMSINGFKESKNLMLTALKDKDAMVRRRACEALVRARIEPPVEALAGVLGDDDVYVRTAARLVLQRIDPKQWTERIWKTDDRKVMREGIVALCKIDRAAEHAEAIFDRLHEGAPGEKAQDVLDHLRTIQLALVHTTKRPGSVRGIALDCLEMFPHKDPFVNRELAIVLTQLRREKILDEPVHEKLLTAMLKTTEKTQAIHYFYCLRLLHDGWTKEQKTALLDWFEATRDWRGGASFNGFLTNILKDLSPIFTKDERIAVLTKFEKTPHSALALLRSAPAAQLPPPGELRKLLDGIDEKSKLPRAGEVRTALVESIGRTGSSEASAILRSLFDDQPSLQTPVVVALSRLPSDDNWAFFVRALDVKNKQALNEIVSALRRSNVKPKPDDPKPFRNLILSASRLDPANRRQVVELLRHWTGGKRFSGEDNDWQGELVAWSKWFGQTFPKEPALPDVVVEKPPESKWKYDELLAFLEKDGRTGDIARGRIAFEKGQCLKCHRYGKEGEALGPDLTTLSKRFKRSDTLEAILLPSKVISDQYRSTAITMKSGRQVIGLTAIQGDDVTVLQSDGTKTTLKKSEIESQVASLISVMPDRLLDMLTREEIRDLFAYLESEPVK